METMNLLATLWGLWLIVMPLSLLLNPKMVKELFAIVDHEPTLFLKGAAAFILGAATVLLTGNVWDRSWETIITILGWASLLKGLVILFATSKAAAWDRSIKDAEWLQYGLLVSVFIGLVCLYFGWSA